MCARERGAGTGTAPKCIKICKAQPSIYYYLFTKSSKTIYVCVVLKILNINLT